jgi:hypothetical protein
MVAAGETEDYFVKRPVSLYSSIINAGCADRSFHCILRKLSPAWEAILLQYFRIALPGSVNGSTFG